MDVKRKVWDNFQVVGEVYKSESTKFVVNAAVRDGYRYINIREFYKRKKDDGWAPSRDGITVPLKSSTDGGKTFVQPYEQLKELIEQAAEVVSKMDLLSEENAVWVEVKTRL